MSQRQPLVDVAMGLLHQDGCFLMQLRDDSDRIVHPGCWAFFGGHIEPGEAILPGLRRELEEEIGHVPEELSLFRQAEGDGKRRHYYSGVLSVPLAQLQLNEGQDLALCSRADIEKGEKYSPRLGEVRSLGKPHQQILLDFIATYRLYRR